MSRTSPSSSAVGLAASPGPRIGAAAAVFLVALAALYTDGSGADELTAPPQDRAFQRAVVRLGEALPERLAKILATPPEKRSDAEKSELQRMHRAQDGEYQRLAARVAQAPPADKHVTGAQDLTWALINSPGFLFNH